jgi:hypothetical protein
MPQGDAVLLSAMTERGHTPQIPRRTGSAIRTECTQCGLSGVVHVDAAGEYVENSAQGEAFAVECPIPRGLERR